MNEAKPIVGQFAVVKSSYSWGVYRVVSATAKQFKGVDDKWGARQNTISSDNCVYCGDETVARKLYDRLVSSENQFNNERVTAAERRSKRDADLIAAAVVGGQL